MKRKLLACFTSLTLLLSALLVGSVGAHPIKVIDPGTQAFDRSHDDWFADVPAADGTAMIARNNVNQGEFIFNDFTRDQRVITTTQSITRSADLAWFAVTGDPTYFSVLAKMDRIRSALSDPQVELMVAISTNQATGRTALPDTVGVTVTTAAAWEYVVQTNFDDDATPPQGNFNDPRVWNGTGGGSPTVSNCSDCEAQLTGSSNGTSPGNFIEIKVPWSRIGGKPASSAPLRLTVATFYNDHDFAVLPNDGHPNSLLIDVASKTKFTKDVLDLGAIDSYFDVHFDAEGEVFSPLRIIEFNPNPAGSEPPGPTGAGTEWIEIYNGSTFPVQLNNYKIGDTPTIGSNSESIRRFPSKTLAPGDIVLVVQRQDMPPINTVPAAANLTIYESSANTANGNDLTPYTTPADRFIGLTDQRDQLVLFDGVDTIVDFVEYTNEGNPEPPFPNSVPYLFPPGGSPAGNQYSYERCPASTDTNNAVLDFLPHDTFGLEGSSPTPGQLCPPATGVDLEVREVAQPETVLAGGTVNFVIDWSNLGGGTFSSVIVTDTLPANITLNSQSSKPAAAFTQSGQNLSWNFTGLTAPVSGTIILTATVSPSALGNVPLVNKTGVRSNDPNRVEPAFRLTNNFTEVAVTPSKPDIAVSSTWPGGAPAGSQVNYVITYANNGVGAASNVIVTDTLPAGVTFLPTGSTPPTSISGQVIAWNIGELDPLASGTLNVRVQINAGQGAQLTNNIVITATPPDDPTATANNSESRILVVGATPDLRVSTAGWPATASPGTQFCYTINYSYPTGAIAANGVTIKDVLPFGLSMVSQTTTAGPALNFSATGSTLTWTRPTSMAIGASGAIQVCVKIRSDVVVGTVVNNVVTINGSVDPDPNAGNNKESKPLTFDKHKLFIPFVHR
ncbi:MAG TPA: lamin tail domain-containing protein [Roseiflexaceae bacterium]|nr:lamin tail domain-containing protein [Roseiflexaceae bacterium]